MYDMDLLNKQIQVIHGQVLGLHQLSPQSKSVTTDVLPIALKELGLASEELQVAVEELTRQNEALTVVQHEANAARFRYQSLFEFAPDALIITTLSGAIQEVNRAAATLFERHMLYLIEKPLVSLVTLDDRTAFRNILTQISQQDGSANGQRNRAQLSVRLQRRQQDWFEAGLTVDVIRNDQDEPLLLRWQVQDLSSRKRSVAALTQASSDVSKFRSCDRYRKGEVIPVEPQTLWLVKQGIVKLTTLSRSGEEIVVGLVAEEHVFGACLTALPVYQAIALSDVELVVIPVAEIAQSVELTQALLPRIMQRLQRAEQFLMMHGHLRVQERFNQLLRLLKEELGEAVPASDDTFTGNRPGVRLKVKLTHQDFASACCTTRVTITRLLGQLQQQGKLYFDSYNHLIIRD
ncbi:MAG: helix-turn-helix domain-containing protein [Myxacorys chilensis ATA2-1-KO14]|jgi:PAS domain S-box-containing protein|nr:helix-turn-helix domain-containing protein [Myxacorys chilensis ATA2-1-KO14]